MKFLTWCGLPTMPTRFRCLRLWSCSFNKSFYLWLHQFMWRIWVFILFFVFLSVRAWGTNKGDSAKNQFQHQCKLIPSLRSGPLVMLLSKKSTLYQLINKKVFTFKKYNGIRFAHCFFNKSLAESLSKEVKYEKHVIKHIVGPGVEFISSGVPVPQQFHRLLVQPQ